MQDSVRQKRATCASPSRFGIWNLIFVILLIAFALRVYRLDAQSIWWDEGHSIQMASAPLAQISTLPGMDVHPPGYFALLHQWMVVTGRSEFALRYLSVAFSLLTVALLMRFGRMLTGRRSRPRALTTLLVGGMAALSPLYVAYAQEVRMYAAVTFFALASVYFQWRILEDWKAGGLAKQPSNFQPSGRDLLIWPVAGYAVTTAVSLYTHYFTLFLLLFENLAWLIWVTVRRPAGNLRRRRLALWLGTQLATLVLFLPQLPLALRQTTAYANPNLTPPGVGKFISRSWLAYTVGTGVDPSVGIWVGTLLALVLGLVVLLQIVTVRQETQDDRLGRAAFLSGWFLIPLAAYFLVLQRRPSFEPRYMMLVTPALMLLLAWGLAGPWTPANGHWPMAINRSLSTTGYLLVAVAFGWGVWSYFTNVEFYKDDSGGVAAWLAAETTSSDVVYVDVPHPFHYYAERIPAPTRYFFVDVHTAAEVLNVEAAGRDRIFWVTWWGSDTDPRGVIPFLLDKVGRRAGEVDFRGYNVVWWDLPPDARFSLPDDLPPLAKYPQGYVALGDVVRLDGLAFSDTAQAGGMAWATLHFTLLRDTNVDYRVSLRLHRPEGDMLPPTDKDLLDDRHFRTSAWPMDDPHLNQAINVYTLPVPFNASPGDYCLEAVVYDATTLEALPITGVPSSGCTSPGGNGRSALLGIVVISP